MHVIARHYDITGKECPVWFVDHEDEWDSLRVRVSRLLEENILFETERGEYL
jgi:hypothetical protein